MIQVTVHGAEGRMGRLVTDLIDATDDLRLSGLVTEIGQDSPAGEFHPRLPLTPQDRLSDVHPPGGVIVDFSLSPALEGLLAGGTATEAPLVIGTTGHDESQMAMLRSYAAERTVVLASNFSIGIPVLKLVLEQLAAILPEGFMPEQIEMHHRHKVDKPSGTARSLALAWEAKRGEGAVPTHSVRVGGVTGEHSWDHQRRRGDAAGNPSRTFTSGLPARHRPGCTVRGAGKTRTVRHGGHPGGRRLTRKRKDRPMDGPCSLSTCRKKTPGGPGRQRPTWRRAKPGGP